MLDTIPENYRAQSVINVPNRDSNDLAAAGAAGVFASQADIFADGSNDQESRGSEKKTRSVLGLGNFMR